MRFWISNPPFNIGNLDNIAGTGGNAMLYKTASRFCFKQMHNSDVIAFITLKGIIKDLLSGDFCKYQIYNIDLMDDLSIWDYNTCYWIISKTPKQTNPIFSGGPASKIMSFDPEDCFEFVYYSGSNRSYDKYFDVINKNRVVRRLPGKNNDEFIFDFINFTEKDISTGPKFAFSVLESKKSYSITKLPIFGGTICYVPTKTIAHAKKLKKFVENNPVFGTVVKAMNMRGHSFALRYMRKFDLEQIKTGLEIPKEWNLSKEERKKLEDNEYPKKDLLSYNALKTSNEIISWLRYDYQITSSAQKSLARIKKNGEIFTPLLLVNKILDNIEQIYGKNCLIDPTNQIIEPFCGDGVFLSEILLRRLDAGVPIEQAISSLYGVDKEMDNVVICRSRLGLNKQNKNIDGILLKNIVCADSLKFNFDSFLFT